MEEGTADQDYNNKMFLVVRSLKVGNEKVDYTLQKGDIMKIGRIKFKVKDFRTDKTRANEENSPTKVMRDEFGELDYPDSCEEAVEIDCGVL